MRGKPPVSSKSIRLSTVSREMMAFGMKGAALAAFGEIPAGFLAETLAPLGDKKEGVKLGESTFNDFFN